MIHCDFVDDDCVDADDGDDVDDDNFDNVSSIFVNSSTIVDISGL